MQFDFFLSSLYFLTSHFLFFPKKCPHCFSKNFRKKYQNEKRIQFYFCRNCQKTFSFLKKMTLKCIHSGLDFLKIRGIPNSVFFQSVFLGIDGDNTDTRNLDLFGQTWILTFSPTPLGFCSYFSTPEGEKLFSVEKLSESAKKFQKLPPNELYVNVNFYGSFFAFSRLGLLDARKFVFDFVNEKIFSEKLVRADIAFDFLGMTPEQIFRLANPQRRVRSVFLGKDGNPETYYIGDTTRNPRVFIRIYDKKRDTLAKNKHRFYGDYLAKNESITRVEFECRSTALSEYGATFRNLFDSGFLSAFAEKLSRSPYLRLSVDFSKNQVVRIPQPNGVSGAVDYYAPRLISIADKLRALGADPVGILTTPAEWRGS
jgi:hypothetical protein